MVMMMVFVFLVFVVVVMVVLFVVVIVVVFDFVDPRCRCGHFVEVEHTGVQYLVEIDVAIVAIDDFGFGLYGADYLADAVQLAGFHFRRFVEQNDVAEFNLLYYKVFDIFFGQSGTQQVFAAAKFVLHSQCVDNRNDAVDYGHSVARVFLFHRRYGADGLGNRGGFADAAGLDDDIVESAHLDDVAQLFDQIHLERAADAAVLQGHEAVVLLAHDAAFFDKVGVDVDFADIVDDNSKFNAFFVAEYSV